MSGDDVGSAGRKAALQDLRRLSHEATMARLRSRLPKKQEAPPAPGDGQDSMLQRLAQHLNGQG